VVIWVWAFVQVSLECERLRFEEQAQRIFACRVRARTNDSQSCTSTLVVASVRRKP